MYIGPMYVWYNNILRFVRESLDSLAQWTPSHIRTWKEEGWATPFTTTLHVLNSAIIKLSRTMKAFRVYRGTKGGILPPQFWTPNDMNVRGGIELGFMSTTLTRNVAMDYATSDEGNTKEKRFSRFPSRQDVEAGKAGDVEMTGVPATTKAVENPLRNEQDVF